MKISKLDRASLMSLDEEIFAAVKKIADARGLVATQKGGRFERLGTSGTISYGFAVPADSPIAVAAGETKKNLEAELLTMYGVQLGTDFFCDGELYRVTGYKITARRTPIIAERVSTKRSYRFPLQTVRDGITVVPE